MENRTVRLQPFALILLLTTVIVPYPTFGQCQPVQIEAPSQRVTLSASNSSRTCTLPSGGYAKLGTSYRIDETIEAKGICQVQTWSGGQCQPSYVQARSIGASTVYESTSALGYVYPTGIVQLVDTSVPTNTSSVVTFYASIEGPHAIKSKTNFHLTYCAFQPADGLPADNEPLEINVLKCEPVFWNNPNGHPYHLPPGWVDIYIPQDMAAASAALQDAINAWNAILAGTGVSFRKVTSDCGTGPSCVHLSTPTPEGQCGYTQAGRENLATGEIIERSTILLREDWATYGADALRRSFTHEMGHLLGMGDYTSSCGISDAVMQKEFNCTTETLAYNPTVSDYIPVANTVYGRAPQDKCGF